MEVHRDGLDNCQQLNAVLESINRSLNGMVLEYVSTKRLCTTRIRLEGKLTSVLSQMSLRFAEGQDSGLSPFKSVSEIKAELEAAAAHKKEVKALEKRIKSNEKKYLKAKAKADKNPSEKNTNRANDLLLEYEELSKQLRDLRGT